MSRTGNLYRGGAAAAIAVLLAAPLAVPAAMAVAGGADDGAHEFAARIDIGDDLRTCSGALVDIEWVLTAASCFVADPDGAATPPAGLPPEATTVTVGRADLTTAAGQVRDVAALVPHESRDLMLVRLASPVVDIAPVGVSAAPPAVGDELVVPGYGRTATEWSPLRRHSGVFVVDAVAGGDVTVTGQDGAAICAGDTGGPALRQTADGVELAAVNSRSWQGGCFGSDPAETRTGAVGTRVDDVIDWISDNAWSTRNVIKAVYMDSLAEVAAPENIAYWEPRVSQNGARVLLQGIESTDRYLTRRIVQAFEETLGRTPTDTQIANHLAWVKDGTRTIDEVEPFLLANPTYYAHVGGTDEQYITALYWHIFDRAPTADNMETWLTNLPRDGRQHMVGALWANGQGVRVRIIETYQQFLGEPPTATQLDYWLDRLVGQTSPTEQPLRIGIVEVARYRDLANQRF